MSFWIETYTHTHIHTISRSWDEVTIQNNTSVTILPVRWKGIQCPFIRNMYFSSTTNRWHAFCISLQSVFMDVIKFFDMVEIVIQTHEHTNTQFLIKSNVSFIPFVWTYRWRMGSIWGVRRIFYISEFKRPMIVIQTMLNVIFDIMRNVHIKSNEREIMYWIDAMKMVKVLFLFHCQTVSLNRLLLDS